MQDSCKTNPSNNQNSTRRQANIQVIAGALLHALFCFVVVALLSPFWNVGYTVTAVPSTAGLPQAGGRKAFQSRVRSPARLYSAAYVTKILLETNGGWWGGWRKRKLGFKTREIKLEPKWPFDHFAAFFSHCDTCM